MKDTGEIVVNGIRTRLDRVGCCNRCGSFRGVAPTVTLDYPALCVNCGHYFVFRPDGAARDMAVAEKRDHIWNHPERDLGKERQERVVERLIG